MSSSPRRTYVKFRTWRFVPLIAGLVVLGEVLMPSVRQVLREGGATWYGNSIRAVVGLVVLGLFMLAWTTVRLDEDAVTIRHGWFPRRRYPWREITAFQLEKGDRPRILEAMTHWGQSPVTYMALTTSATGIRRRVPHGMEGPIRDFVRAYREAVSAEPAGTEASQSEI